MLELTPEQSKATQSQKEPIRLLDPDTQEVYVLVREKVFNLTRNILKRWEDPEDFDLVEQPSEQSHEAR